MIEINEEVQNAIRDCVLKSGQKFEVGGILLGRKMQQKILVEELTIPEDFQNCKRGSFQLDGKVAAESCEKLIAKALGLMWSVCGTVTYMELPSFHHKTGRQINCFQEFMEDAFQFLRFS